MRHGVAQLDVYAPLGLHDAGEDAVQVFAGFLGVLGKLRGVELERLQDVARLPLVGDRHGHDVQLVDGRNLVVGHRQAEHLDDALVGGVVAVLGAAVALGYPHRLAFLRDDMADIVGQVFRAAVELLQAATRAFHLEHLVALANVYNQGVHHQVSPKGYLCRVKAILDKEIL